MVIILQYTNQTIMLYVINLSSDVCRSNLNKTGKKTEERSGIDIQMNVKTLKQIKSPVFLLMYINFSLKTVELMWSSETKHNQYIYNNSDNTL